MKLLTRFYAFSFCTSNPHYLNRTTSSSITTTSITSSTTSIDVSASKSSIDLKQSSTTLNAENAENEENTHPSSNNLKTKYTSKANIVPTSSSSVLNEISSASLNLPNIKLNEHSDLLALNKNGPRRESENDHKQQHHQQQQQQQQHSKPEKSQKLAKYSSVSNVKQIEIWSRTTRKLLESSLKKAILNNNLIKLNKVNEHSDASKITGSVSMFSLSSSKTSPPSTSTLKRSTDIKINLSKLLDRQAYDFLLNVSGANIKHNCTNVNKHGVVINTEDDFPPWLVKAMSTLILWENENEAINIEDQFPKFEDVYNEILSYFVNLKESLMSKEITHLFMQILKLLVMPPQSIQTPKEARKSLTSKENAKKHQHQHHHTSSSNVNPLMKKSTSFEFSKLEKHLPEFQRNEQFNENFFLQSTESLSANIQSLVNVLKGR